MYRIRNWGVYNQGLIARGNLKFWLDAELLEEWQNPIQMGKRGAPCRYSDAVIEFGLTLSHLFNLALRQTQGFIEYLLSALNISVSAPHYATLSRRRKHLNILLKRRSVKDPLHVVVDATGVKIFGEGEWKMRQHGKQKRRQWVKLHLAVNEMNSDILGYTVTSSNVHDSQQLSPLLEQIPEEIEQISGDKAYDSHLCHELIQQRGAKGTIPVRDGSKIRKHGNSRGKTLPRDEVLRGQRILGKKGWKNASGYHRRSLAETAMSRLKRIFGGSLRSRTFESQTVDLGIRVSMLNRMLELGRPESYAVVI